MFLRPLLVLTLLMPLFNNAVAQELESAQVCAECHTQTVAEWKTSRHAMSTAETNPFYAAMLKWANESTGGRAQKECESCHVPVLSLAATSAVTSWLAGEGVTCDVCHATQPAGKWLKPVPGRIKFGPYGDAVSFAHNSEYSEFLTSSDQCLTCHANLESAHGVVFCSTDKEYQDSKFQKLGVTCQDCHMPATEGKTTDLGKIRNIHSHKFYGGYNADFLQNCAALEISASGDSNRYAVEVKVTNRTVGHSLPTGSPLRSVYLSLKALDADGNVLWRNYEVNPLVEDAKAVFMRLLQDDRGAAPVPPWLATSIKFDQRLKPGETRTLNYEVPGRGVVSIVAELNYRLAPPSLLQKLGLETEPYTSVITISTASYAVTQ